MTTTITSPSNDYISQVGEFHTVFEHPIAEPHQRLPKQFGNEEGVLMSTTTLLENTAAVIAAKNKDDSLSEPVRLMLLRLSLLTEELAELSRALTEEDPKETLDALCDLQYVLSGAVLALGYSNCFDAAFTEVHRSNMSKRQLDGSVLKDAAGKVLKPDTYSPAELGQFL